MVFEAVLFLAAAVLFFLSVLFFIFLWQDRVRLLRRRDEIETTRQALKEQRVDLDIWERELEVWSANLDEEQLALTEAKKELRMLTASRGGLIDHDEPSGSRLDGEDGGIATAAKNRKLRDDLKHAG